MRRGYLLKSSDGPNCVGLTKIETTIGEDSPFAARISEKWPSCSAPIVGTRPSRPSDARAACAICFIHSIVWIVSIRLVPDENRDCGGAGSKCGGLFSRRRGLPRPICVLRSQFWVRAFEFARRRQGAALHIDLAGTWGAKVGWRF